MKRIIEDVEAHYESREVPFGKSYQWHPEHVLLECECGERLTLSASSTTTTCRCGAEHAPTVCEIQKREGQLPDKTLHPWHHDSKERAEQHQQDEAAHPKESPWRYNDITSKDVDGE